MFVCRFTLICMKKRVIMSTRERQKWFEKNTWAELITEKGLCVCVCVDL